MLLFCLFVLLSILLQIIHSHFGSKYIFFVFATIYLANLEENKLLENKHCTLVYLFYKIGTSSVKQGKS